MSFQGLTTSGENLASASKTWDLELSSIGMFSKSKSKQFLFDLEITWINGINIDVQQENGFFCLYRSFIFFRPLVIWRFCEKWVKKQLLLTINPGWSPRELHRWTVLFQIIDVFQRCSALIHRTWKKSALFLNLISSDFFWISAGQIWKNQSWPALNSAFSERISSDSVLIQSWFTLNQLWCYRM